MDAANHKVPASVGVPKLRGHLQLQTLCELFVRTIYEDVGER